MQQLNPSEISDIIKSRIEGLDVKSEAQNEGTIVGVSDGIVRVHGLADAQYGEMIEFEGSLYGLAYNKRKDPYYFEVHPERGNFNCRPSETKSQLKKRTSG